MWKKLSSLCFFFFRHTVTQNYKTLKRKSIQPLISCETMNLHTSHTACSRLPGISASNSKRVQESPAWVSDIAQSCCCKGRGALSQCLMPTSEEPSLFTMHRWKIKRRLMQLALVSENSSPQNSLINVLRFRFLKQKTKHKGKKSRCKKRYQGSIPLEYYITFRRLWGWCHSCWKILPCSGRERLAGRMSGLRDHRETPADHFNALCFISASISAQHAMVPWCKQEEAVV